jgi:1-deoxy-D-xylulose-5-phosphate reductoisomerase
MVTRTALVPLTDNRFGSAARPSMNGAVNRSLAILGSTGSIGTSTLDLIRSHRSEFSVELLSAGSNAELLAQQIAEFRPRYAYIASPEQREYLVSRHNRADTKILESEDDLLMLLESGVAQSVVAAIVGFAGLPSVVAALKSGARVALANKESLVSAGELVQTLINTSGGEIIPVDSEHSALFQSLQGVRVHDVKRLVLTASGGPFRNSPAEQFSKITVADALKHPTWSMGAKISIDSATMVNKALELAEACWLFGFSEKVISIVVHPQSIIHSMVQLVDGSSIAQMGLPDMKVPIAYALSYPEKRIPDVSAHLDLIEKSPLEFFPLNEQLFSAPQIMRRALAAGGTAPAVFTIANDLATQAFLGGELSFLGIMEVIQRALELFPVSSYSSLSDLLELRDTINGHRPQLFKGIS